MTPKRPPAPVFPIIAWFALAILVLSTGEINQDTHLGHIARFLSHMGDNAWVALSLVLLALPPILAIKRDGLSPNLWRIWDATIINFAIVDGLGKSHLTALHRPNAPDPGFPSGHATYAFLVCRLMQDRYPQLAPLWYAIAVAISWSRVAVGAHYPYQVLGGALIGWGIGEAVTRVKDGIVLPRVLLPFLPKAKAEATENQAAK